MITLPRLSYGAGILLTASVNKRLDLLGLKVVDEIVRIKLNLKEDRGWIFWIIRGGEITPERFCLALPSYSTNQGSTDKDVCPVILCVRILWFCSKEILYDISRISTPLDLIQDPLFWLGICQILAGSSGCMVSRLREDADIFFHEVAPQLSTDYEPKDTKHCVTTRYWSRGQIYYVTFYYVLFYARLGIWKYF